MTRTSPHEDAVQILEQVVHAQHPAVTRWQPVTDYSVEARRAREGRHPALIRDVFRPRSILNVGCGPGYLDGWLRDAHVRVEGMDVHPPKGPHFWRQDLCDTRPIQDWAIPGGDYDLVICREVLEHLTVRQIVVAVRNLCQLSTHYVYLTTRFNDAPAHVLDIHDHDDLDPTHITLMPKALLRALFVLQGCRSRHDLEARMDWQQKGRCLVFEVPR